MKERQRLSFLTGITEGMMDQGRGRGHRQRSKINAGGQKVTDVETPSRSHLSYLAMLTPDVDLHQDMVAS